MPDPIFRAACLARHNLRAMLREPGPLLSRFILPLAFLTLLRPLYVAAQGQTAGTEQAVAGTLVTFSLLALSIVGDAIITERIGRTWERLRATPAHPLELLAGKAIPVLLALLTQQAVVLAAGTLFFGLDIRHPLLLLSVLFCWSVALLGLGATLGVVARTVGELSAAYDLGGMLLSSLGGALVPLSVLPGWVADVAPASPGYWANHGLHAALAGDAGTAATACGTLLGVAVLFGTLAATRLQGSGGRLAAY